MQSGEVHCKQKHHTRQWLLLFDLVLPGKLAFSKKKKNEQPGEAGSVF